MAASGVIVYACWRSALNDAKDGLRHMNISHQFHELTNDDLEDQFQELVRERRNALNRRADVEEIECGLIRIHREMSRRAHASVSS